MPKAPRRNNSAMEEARLAERKLEGKRQEYLAEFKKILARHPQAVRIVSEISAYSLGPLQGETDQSTSSSESFTAKDARRRAILRLNSFEKNEFHQVINLLSDVNGFLKRKQGSVNLVLKGLGRCDPFFVLEPSPRGGQSYGGSQLSNMDAAAGYFREALLDSKTRDLAEQVAELNLGSIAMKGREKEANHLAKSHLGSSATVEKFSKLVSVVPDGRSARKTGMHFHAFEPEEEWVKIRGRLSSHFAYPVLYLGAHLQKDDALRQLILKHKDELVQNPRIRK